MEAKQTKWDFFVGTVRIIIEEKGSGYYCKMETPDFQQKGKRVTTKFGFKNYEDFRFFATQFRQIIDRIKRRPRVVSNAHLPSILAELIVKMINSGWVQEDRIASDGINTITYSKEGIGMEIRIGDYARVFPIEEIK